MVPSRARSERSFVMSRFPYDADHRGASLAHALDDIAAIEGAKAVTGYAIATGAGVMPLVGQNRDLENGFLADANVAGMHSGGSKGGGVGVEASPPEVAVSPASDLY